MCSSDLSQVPLTTQPSFLPFNYNDLRRFWNLQLDHLILRFDTVSVKRPKRTKATPAASKSWQKTPYANLIRYVPSGAYFARIRVGGKLIRQSLKTKVLSVAKLRLGDLEKQERSGLEAQAKLGEGNAAVRELVNLWRERMESDHSVKPRTKIYYEERLAALLKSWGGREIGRAHV